MVKSIRIDGKDYPFRFTLNTLIKFSEETGKEGLDAFNNLGFADVRKIAFLGIESGCKVAGKEMEVTEEELGDVLGVPDLKTVTALFTESISKPKTAGEVDEKKEGSDEKK